MKRKGLEDTNDDFSFIFLSSPSRKSWRLGCDLLSIEKDDPRTTVPQVPEQPLTSTDVVQENVPDPDAITFSEEKALVLYDPANIPFLKSPSAPDFALTFNSDLKPSLKDRVFWPGNSKTKAVEDGGVVDKSIETTNHCLAVVPWVAPWVPPQVPLAFETEAPVMDLSEPTEADEVEAEMMDMEDTSSSSNTGKSFVSGRMLEGKGFQLWQQQQQHCMAPELLQNKSTPVTW